MKSKKHLPDWAYQILAWLFFLVFVLGVVWLIKLLIQAIF